MSGPPEDIASGIKSFLIADVRGFTRFTEERGDEAAARLSERFADIVEEVAAALTAGLVELRGDEGLAVFGSPRHALRAAVELQRRFVQETFSDQSMPFPVGIGLDAGEAAPAREGFRGAAINLAARLCSVAGPGEILASQEFAHLAGKVDDFSYQERGEMMFKNVAHPVRVVRVVPSGEDPAERFAGLASDHGAPARLRVLLVDDSVLFREGVARVLGDAGFDIAAQLGDAEHVLDVIRAYRPDVVVLDIRMPPTHTNEGLLAAQRIREEFPEVGVIVLSQYVESRHATELLRNGSGKVGYLLKDRVADVSDFTEAVRKVDRGGAVIDPEVVSQLLGRRQELDDLEDLDEKERDILGLMAEGRSDQAIAERLSLSLEVVRNQVRDVLAKLGLPPDPHEVRRVMDILAYLRG